MNHKQLQISPSPYFLQHGIALFPALEEGASRLLWIERLSVCQTRQGQLRCCVHHVRVATSGRSIGERCNFRRRQVTFPRVDENVNRHAANLYSLT